MVTLNPITGVLFDDDTKEPLDSGEVLYFLEHNFQVDKATEDRFCLHSIRRMFEKYPALMSVNGWCKDFMKFAILQQPKIGLVTADAQKNGERKLILQRTVRMKSSELSIGSVDIVDKQADIPNIHGFKTSSIKVVFKDQPSLENEASTGFSMLIDGELSSLSFTRMEEIYWQRIHILNAVHYLKTEYATADRQRIDHSRSVSIEVNQDYPDLTLSDVIHAIVMDMNLDDEEEFEEGMQEIKDALSLVKAISLEISDESNSDDKKPD